MTLIYNSIANTMKSNVSFSLVLPYTEATSGGIL